MLTCDIPMIPYFNNAGLQCRPPNRVVKKTGQDAFDCNPLGARKKSDHEHDPGCICTAPCKTCRYAELITTTPTSTPTTTASSTWTSTQSTTAAPAEQGTGTGTGSTTGGDGGNDDGIAGGGGWPTLCDAIYKDPDYLCDVRYTQTKIRSTLHA